MSRGWGVGIVLAIPLILVVGLMMLVVHVEEEVDNLCPGGTPGPGGTAAVVNANTVPKGPVAGYSGQQLVHAATIMVVAQERGLSLREQRIGVMVAMGESSLTNLTHGDAARADTIGLFQIGPEHGARADRLNPEWAAGNFYDRLEAVPGQETLEPTIAAHRAQRNADPYHYERYWEPASAVVAALGNVQTSAPVTVPTTETAGASSYNLGAVQPQLRALVAVLGPMFGIKVVGGYRAGAIDPGGHPSGLAADFMVPLTTAGTAQGEALAAYAVAHAAELKVDYVLWRQRIWSAARASEGWRPMSDRGSATANHFDHVHINALPGTSPTSSTSGTTEQVSVQNCAQPVSAVSGAWIAPVDAPVTSEYGPRIHPINGGMSFHDGVDYGASCEAPFKAASAGVVVKAGPDPIYGHQIIIDHGGGIKTRYGHMYAAGVRTWVGAPVLTGDVIGTVGSDGWSTACHLHFTVEVDGETTDPIAFLANPPTTGAGLSGGVTFAHANIRYNLPQAQFLADRSTTISGTPDFLSYNEVAYRSDAQLEPPGYAVFRAPGAPPISQTRGTAIAWRTDRWQRVAAGRTLLVPNGPQRSDAGRSATWATVQNGDGEQLSIVSVHQMINPRNNGPDIPRRRELYAAGMRRLQALVSTLEASGPVLVAGDFNSHYSANDPWGPRAMLGALGMRSSFDTLGPASTHDQGGVIDYIFSPGSLVATDQVLRNLNSDHHALTVTFAPKRGVVP